MNSKKSMLPEVTIINTPTMIMSYSKMTCNEMFEGFAEWLGHWTEDARVMSLILTVSLAKKCQANFSFYSMFVHGISIMYLVEQKMNFNRNWQHAACSVII